MSEIFANDAWITLFNTNGSFEVGKEPDSTVVNGAFRFTGVSVAQGITIQGATLSIYVALKGSGSGDIKTNIWGMDDDNTADFSSSPMGRSKTTATDSSTRSVPSMGEFINYDVGSIVQEIVNRGGWSSGNAMGFIVEDNGSPLDVWVYDNLSSPRSKLNIVLSSPSASPSPSSSVSRSASPSASQSPSASLSPSTSPSPSAMPPTATGVLKIAKPGVNVLTNSDIDKLVFSSEYGTLKYYTKQSINISFDANDGDISATGSYTHNLGYYPYCEVFVSTYIGAATGSYEYCPFFGSGASVSYDANYVITPTQIKVYGEISGVSSSVWHFDFLVFVFKNDLLLS